MTNEIMRGPLTAQRMELEVSLELFSRLQRIPQEDNGEFVY